MQFIGRDGTGNPNFGPDSATSTVCAAVYYTEDGKFRIPLAPGKYDVIVSHGPEYDAVFTSIDVARGKETPLATNLKRTVDTQGWVSADFHSHSSPSGDNTCSQSGRVLNLFGRAHRVCPCTELYNRITVYDPHLEHFSRL